jgi:hypothetical protein
LAGGYPPLQKFLWQILYTKACLTSEILDPSTPSSARFSSPSTHLKRSFDASIHPGCTELRRHFTRELRACPVILYM